MLIGDEAVTFRAAAAQDVDAAVPLIYSSGPAAFDYVFGCRRPDEALGFLRFAFVHRGGEFGYRVHEVATIAGQVVAAGAAFDGKAVLRFAIAGATQILKYYVPVDAWGVIARGLRAEAIIRPPRAHEHYLCHLGVSPARPSSGIGTRLVRHLLARIDSSRHRAATLDVSVENSAAQRLYARLGFSVTALRASTLANRDGRVADHSRMTRPVDAGPAPAVPST